MRISYKLLLFLILILALVLPVSAGLTYDVYTTSLLHGNATGVGVGGNYFNMGVADEMNRTTTGNWTSDNGIGYMGINQTLPYYKFGGGAFYVNQQYGDTPSNWEINSTNPNYMLFPTHGYDVTLEGWFNITSMGSSPLLIDLYDPNGATGSSLVGTLALQESGGALNVLAAGTTVATTGGAAVTANTWNHIAVTGYYNGSTELINIWLNGNNIANGTIKGGSLGVWPGANQSRTFVGGKSNAATAAVYCLPGGSQFDEIRISNTSRYTSNFIPMNGEFGNTVVSAAFTGTPTNGALPLSVTFTDTSAGLPTTWLWDFGDGTTSSLQNPVHSYAAQGNYYVNLTANNSMSISSVNVTNYIHAGYFAPTTVFTANTTIGNAPLSIAFTDQSSNSATGWNWSFGDGNVSNAQNPVWTYAKAGTYNVNLTTNNTYGSSILVKAAYITVYPTGYPLTAFTCSPTSGNPALLVSCIDQTTGTTPLTYNWTFGDNGTWIASTAQNPSHVYSTAGIFTVTENVSNPVGFNVLTKSNYITASTNQQNTWWTPHTVQITLMDTYGMRLTNVQINATYNQSAMPTSWIQQMYGLQSGPTGDLLNQTLVMGGLSGSDGTITFTMLGSLKYDIYLTSTQYGLNNYHVQAFPSDSMLNIYITPPGTNIPTSWNNTYAGLSNVSVYVVEPDINHVNMCINYQDLNATTIFVNESWYFLNNDTIWYSVNTTPADGGLAPTLNCAQLQNVRGTQVWWGYKYARSN